MIASKFQDAQLRRNADIFLSQVSSYLSFPFPIRLQDKLDPHPFLIWCHASHFTLLGSYPNDSQVWSLDPRSCGPANGYYKARRWNQGSGILCSYEVYFPSSTQCRDNYLGLLRASDGFPKHRARGYPHTDPRCWYQRSGVQ